MEARFKSKRRERRRRVMITRAILGGLALLLILWAIGFLLRLDSITIRDIEIQGVENVSTENIRERIEQQLRGSYLFVLPRRSTFAYPREAIRTDLLESFPRIERVDIAVGSQTLAVQVYEREAFALWCRSLSAPDLAGRQASESECYFLDDTGFVFASAPLFSGNVYFVYYGLLPQEGEVVGGQYIDSVHFRELTAFIESLSDVGFFPARLQAESNELFVVETANGTLIRIDAENSLDQTLENLQVILQDPVLMESRRGEFRNLEYVDLRFGSKVFYKLRE